MQKYKQYIDSSLNASASILGVYKTSTTVSAIRDLKSVIQGHPIVAEKEKVLNVIDVSNITRDILNNHKFSNKVEFIKEELCAYFNADLCQIGFTLRINEPGQKAAHFHLDKWVGHPSKIINAWIPLNSLNEGNTLYSCSIENTKNILSKMSSEDFVVTEVERLASMVAEPILGDEDQIFLFSNEFLHGSFTNTSTRRISIDFRMAFFNKFDGVRTIGVDYKFLHNANIMASSASPRTCQVLTYQNNDAKHVNLRAQRQKIQEYASKNNFLIESEWSEFHGYNSFPQLRHLLKTLSVPIIIFSKKCLMKDGVWIDKALIEATKNYKFGVHYALEGE